MTRTFLRLIGTAAAFVLFTGCGSTSGSAAPVATVTGSGDAPPADTVTVPGPTPPAETQTAVVTEREPAETVTAVVTRKLSAAAKTVVVTRTERETLTPSTVIRTMAVTVTESAPAPVEPTDGQRKAPSSATGAPGPAQRYSGAGDDVVDVELGADPRILTFQCTSCSANTVLQADGQDTLLVNVIGSYRGRHYVNSGGDLTRLEITADSSWNITLDPVSVLTADTNRTQGHGDDVVYYDKGSKAAVTHHGDSNFSVLAYSDSGGRDLLVNEIGNYRGVVPLDTPALVQINADGDWTITPS